MKDKRNTKKREDRQEDLMHLIVDKWVSKEKERSKTTKPRIFTTKLFKRGVS